MAAFLLVVAGCSSHTPTADERLAQVYSAFSRHQYDEAVQCLEEALLHIEVESECYIALHLTMTEALAYTDPAKAGDWFLQIPEPHELLPVEFGIACSDLEFAAKRMYEEGAKGKALIAARESLFVAKAGVIEFPTDPKMARLVTRASEFALQIEKGEWAPPPLEGLSHSYY